jgi:lipopolysaccharide export system permease protein
MRLYDGHMREVFRDDPKTFRRMRFKEQVFGIPGVGNTLDINQREGAYRGDREMTIGMLQARIDTLRQERRQIAMGLRRMVAGDLEYALAGGTRRFRSDAPNPVADTQSVKPQPGDLRVRTRRTADELTGSVRRISDLDQQMRAFDVEVHKKYSIAVATLVFVILGAPLALRFGGGGIGMVIATSMAIFALYYVGLIGGEALADRGITTPLVAMWVVNAAMTIVGILGLATMGRETATARSNAWDTMLQALAAPRARLRRRKEHAA